MRKILSYSTLFLMLLSNCDYINKEDQSSNNPSNSIVASVGGKNLYRADIANLINQQTPTADSATIVTQFVTDWVKKELLIQEASQLRSINQAEIEQKIADYRYSLISYEYQKQRIRQLLDTVISEEEINTYYDTNKENFFLRQNIIRGRYIKLNKEAPKKESVKRWIKSSRPQDLAELRDYAFQFANNYSLEDSTWLRFNDLIKSSPFSTITNQIQFLRTTRYKEESDSLYLYLLNINEFKISEEPSPLSYVKDEIRNILLNKRKVQLAKEIENEVFQKAIENEDYKIYR